VVANADLIARKPASLSMRGAAALPLVAITAWEVLIDRAKVRRDCKLLIHGGAGGLSVGLSNAYLKSLGLPSLFEEMPT